MCVRVKVSKSEQTSVTVLVNNHHTKTANQPHPPILVHLPTQRRESGNVRVPRPLTAIAPAEFTAPTSGANVTANIVGIRLYPITPGKEARVGWVVYDKMGGGWVNACLRNRARN